jgi:microcystin-dependent protein
MANGITLTRSDRTNGTIFVADGQKNSDASSLTFIGKNAPSFGISVNQDFLYLLENFSNSTPPLFPIQGQIWYDTSNDKTTGLKLKTYDGSLWKPINGLWQQDGQPEAPDRGDVWVDTSRNQVFIRTGTAGTGTNWTLVGPTYSSVLKTGSYADNILDTKGGYHRVIKNYIDDNVIEIISSDAFTPQPPISGFSNGLHAGVNLSSTFNGKLNATATTADALTLANGTTVTGDSLVRTNANSIVNATLSVKILQVGQASTNGTTTPWSLSQTNGTQANIINPVAGGSFVFQATSPDVQGALPVSIVTVKSSGLAINKTSPAYSLDVNGSAGISNTLYLSSTGTVIRATGNVIISQNLTVASTSTFNNVTATGVMSLGNPIETAAGGRPVLLPQATGANAPTIGSQAKPFGAVFANSFGNGNGTTEFVGRLTGSASSLNTSSWAITGQVSAALYKTNRAQYFDGTKGDWTLVASLQNSAITAQTTATSVQVGDKLLLAKVNDPLQLYQISKADLLQNEVPYLVPTGAILPYAGLANKVPSGWLLCDGSLIDSGFFVNLFATIKYTYGKGARPSQFRIPDMRSRIPMGFDDMSNTNINYAPIGSTSGAPSSPSGRTTVVSPDNAQSYELGVQGPVVGEVTGATYTTATNATINTAIHYHGLNYIIKT